MAARLVPELLAAAASKNPRRTAVIGPDGRALNYGELAARIDRLAAWLFAEGVGRGDRIAVRAANGLLHFDTFLAAARLGAAAVPVPTGMASPEVARLMERVRPAIGFADDAGAGALHAAGVDVVVEGSDRHAAALSGPWSGSGPGRGSDDSASVGCSAPGSGASPGSDGSVSGGASGAGAGRYDGGVGNEAGSGPGPDSDFGGGMADEAGDLGLPAMPEPEDIVLIVPTSGSTGEPKGVCLSQAAVCANAPINARSQEFGDHEVYLASTPLYHTTAAARVFTMLDGAHTHIVMAAFEPEAWIDAVETHRVTTAIVAPTQVRRILDADGFDPERLASLRLLAYGTAPSSGAQVRRMRRSFGCGLYHGYGLSETCGVVTALDAADHRTLGGLDDPRWDSIGRPIEGVEVVVRDRHGWPVPPGQIGEITVRSPKLMSGYWDDPTATAAALVDGWLRTGDLATVDVDGYLTLAGRTTGVIISGGVNIDPAAVERVIANHPDVEEVAVFGIPDPDWGETPAAAVRLRPGAALSATEISEHVASRLDRRSRPRHVVFVDDFPRTPTGKIRRPDLPGLLK